MIRIVQVIAGLFVMLAGPATWADEAPRCGSPILFELSLTRVSCEERGAGSVERYRDSAPLSPYATEFDRRNVVVARSADPVFFIEAAGLGGAGKVRNLTQTRLVTPPAVDQLQRRQVAKAVARHAGWTVYTEHLVYKAQGNARGFVIDCATGIRSGRGKATAVAECFALEERARFLRTLEATH